MATAPATQAINTLLAGSMRIPCLALEVTATYHLAILSLKVVRTALEYFGWNGESKFAQKAADYVPDAAKAQWNLANNMSWTNLGKTVALCGILGAVGTEVVEKLFGPAHPIYNKTLAWVGHVRLGDNWNVSVMTKQLLNNYGLLPSFLK